MQTQAIQECEFQLVVSDGELTSPPARVKVLIVPDLGPSSSVVQENPPFDPNKPTIIYFGGGDCVTGNPGQRLGDAGWYQKVNVLCFASGYAFDSIALAAYRTYYNVADTIIVFLSKIAPQYEQPIQILGWSTGGQPALDAAIRLNRVYKDSRYVVNHVTELEAPCRWKFEGMSIYDSVNVLYRTSVADGGQCWHDHYWGATFPMPASGPNDVLGAYLVGYDHPGVSAWYKASLTSDVANQFNHGAVAGAYWSVAGPGKNLQLASTPGAQTYQFRWTGVVTTGQMEFYDDVNHPGRLPEPVALGAWVSRSEVSGDVNGAVLTCDEGENAVGYQLLFGSDPHRVMDFNVISDTPTPPTKVISAFPSGTTWWTMRARDSFGSTIYADPVRLDLTNLPPMRVENTRTGKRYVLLRHAIASAKAGDVILLDRGPTRRTLRWAGRL